METDYIIKKIDQLPIEQRILIIEKTLRSIREQEFADKMERAVNELKEEYETNKELTAFSDIDFEDFYDSKHDK